MANLVRRKLIIPESFVHTETHRPDNVFVLSIRGVCHGGYAHALGAVLLRLDLTPRSPFLGFFSRTGAHLGSCTGLTSYVSSHQHEFSHEREDIRMNAVH